jgi:hypothetical protein
MHIISAPALSSARRVSTDSWISAPSRKPQPDSKTPTLAMIGSFDQIISFFGFAAFKPQLLIMQMIFQQPYL